MPLTESQRQMQQVIQLSYASAYKIHKAGGDYEEAAYLALPIIPETMRDAITLLALHIPEKKGQDRHYFYESVGNRLVQQIIAKPNLSAVDLALSIREVGERSVIEPILRREAQEIVTEREERRAAARAGRKATAAVGFQQPSPNPAFVSSVPKKGNLKKIVYDEDNTIGIRIKFKDRQARDEFVADNAQTFSKLKQMGATIDNKIGSFTTKGYSVKITSSASNDRLKRKMTHLQRDELFLLEWQLVQDRSRVAHNNHRGKY